MFIAPIWSVAPTAVPPPDAAGLADRGGARDVHSVYVDAAARPVVGVANGDFDVFKTIIDHGHGLLWVVGAEAPGSC